MPRVHPKDERLLYCPKAKKQTVKNEMAVEELN
jgi:hypothetical protein